ncbi:hypothetical protein COP2_028656 [Malus domestica]
MLRKPATITKAVSCTAQQIGQLQDGPSTHATVEKKTKMLRNRTTQPYSDYASSFLHCTATSPPRENCDQKALHNANPLQSFAQHHTVKSDSLE